MLSEHPLAMMPAPPCKLQGGACIIIIIISSSSSGRIDSFLVVIQSLTSYICKIMSFPPKS